MSAGDIRGVPRPDGASRAGVRAALKDGSRAVSAGGGAGPGVTDAEVKAAACAIVILNGHEDPHELVMHPASKSWEAPTMPKWEAHEEEARAALKAAAQARAAAPGPDRGKAAGLEPPGCPIPGACACPGGERRLAERLGEMKRERDAAVMALGERDHELDEAENDLAAAEARAERAVEVLRRLEWAGADWVTHGSGRLCPVCGGEPDVKAYGDRDHAPDCALAAQLGGPAREGTSQKSSSDEVGKRDTPQADPAAAGRAAVRRAWIEHLLEQIEAFVDVPIADWGLAAKIELQGNIRKLAQARALTEQEQQP